MIKFFRKIRQNMIKENKVSNYLLYAIGEVVLVVIGILIALSINNWNENRVNKNKFEAYLGEMIIDLKLDVKSFDHEIAKTSMSISKTKSFLAHKDYSTFKIDSLEKSLETFSAIISINKSTFNKIEDSGITDFGEYNDLYNEISEYYNYKILKVLGYSKVINRQVEEEDKVWRYQQQDYEFKYSTELTSLQNNEDAKEILIKLIKSPTARNILKIDFRRKTQLLGYIQSLKGETLKLISSIGAELKNE